ncbi:MAG: sugar ABC transporter permease [Oscillospiraceae bacterium]|nr:sugar ABC transporter permease [Oscillospiraceae bacterium]
MDALEKQKIPRKRSSIDKNKYGYLFVTPFILGILIFTIYPVIYTLYLGLTNTTIMTKQSDFVGFQNYVQLFKDKVFLNSVITTWKLWLLNFIPQLGVALLFSVWFTSTRLKIRFVGFWRTIFYLPNLLMPVTIAVLFNALLSFYGPINQFLVRIGILKQAADFLRMAGVMQGTVSYIQWWMWFGSTIIIITAGMTSISASLYESAMVDGASSMGMFTRITLPLLRPILLYILVTSLVGGMQMFDIPFMLTDTKGSPNFSILTMVMSMYMRFASSKGNLGTAATVGTCIFIITSVVSLILFRFLRSKDVEPKKKRNKVKGGAKSEL